MGGQSKKGSARADGKAQATGGGWSTVDMMAYMLIMCRCAIAATLSHITDCDEVYNYWEPTHYLLHGSGMQTWEYSPVYALRSWAYIAIHAALLSPFQALGVDKITQFYCLRAVLALASAAAELSLYHAIKKRGFGTDTALAFAFFLGFSPGMFISSAAFLPSSAAMVLCTLAFAAWINGRDNIPLIGFDSMLYQKLVVAPWNIVMYNVLSSETSSELYGTEPWHFYIFNSLLNFNVAFILALLAPVLTLVAGWLQDPVRPRLLYLIQAPLWVWLAIFVPQAHKEERFLFPVYPLICLAGAIGLSKAQYICRRILPTSLHGLIKRFQPLVLAVFVILALSRVGALYRNYHAPLDVYARVPEVVAKAQDPNCTICVGKEWYRYPSSFFLPGTCQLGFLQSEFKGQLPQPFAAENGTFAIPPNMNDMNREEPSRYVELSSCTALVDRASSYITSLEPNYDALGWKRAFCSKFLDAANSNALGRALLLPGNAFGAMATFSDYCLYMPPRK
ncbi:uncharacterized protein MONBRDRAFT_26137 [Monosiga brevicollis MX1]|uniref:Mannosyltransferase n=1 Tax=Monosiga brevicollis TaxID=81824 RepID=A9V1G7_MONBE|nr:uncharacterized protein MONBRDRAFT_26137 [Monosiga brevicollis MX1]EDQ88564.1 predicted protein [Monosiga brevicollis MX1]|eukprot:XP_001746668.1 hypothetical protein [Monosiga brevicollis MX1]